MAYISAHDYQFPGRLLPVVLPFLGMLLHNMHNNHLGAWHVSDFLLKGYFHGKKAAEAALFAALPDGGVALRPGFIYGTRRVSGMPLPLGIVGAPLEAVWCLVEILPNTHTPAQHPYNT